MAIQIVTLDIETENTGFDIKEDNKRIISVQILDETDSRIYYDGSYSNNLEAARKDLRSMIQNENRFLGFNIRNFDIPFIKKFLGIEIPSSQIIDISEMTTMNEIRKRLGKRNPRLEEICKLVEVDCVHKELMHQRSLKFKQLPEVTQKAKEGATKWQNELGWGYDFSYNLALDRICGGMAIMEAFEDFVKSKGDPNSFFYKYAMGDVRIEYELYLKLKT
ncbi:MAG: ribonuclease H-like domain-containing protein [Nitrososphaerales archaeon]